MTTARRFSDTQLAALLANVEDGVLAVDTQGSVVLANPAFGELTGFDIGSMVGEQAHELISDLRRAGLDVVEIEATEVAGDHSQTGIVRRFFVVRAERQPGWIEVELGRRVRDEQRLADLTSTFVRSSPDGFDETVVEALEDLADIAGAARASLWTLTGPNLLRRTHAWPSPETAPGHVELHLDEDPVFGPLADLQEVWVGVRSPAAGSKSEHEPEMSKRAVLACPLVAAGVLNGAILIRSLHSSLELSSRQLTMIRAVVAVLAEATAGRSAERHLVDRARLDPLTSATNRWALVADVVGALAEGASADGSTRIAMILIDVDRFAVVNSTYGAAQADSVLTEVARCIRRAVPPASTVARIGGDEFVTLLPGANLASALSVAEQVRQSLKAPAADSGISVPVTVSIGVDAEPATDIDIQELIARADAAMYEAKMLGRDQVVAFDDRLAREIELRRESSRETRTAIESSTLKLSWFREIDLDSGQALGHVPVVRLPNGAEIRRDQLRHAAFLLEMLDDWILDETCKEVARLELTRARLPLGINHVHDPEVSARVAAAIADAGIGPHQLVVGMTEHAIMGDLSRARTTMNELRELGVGVDVTGFGAGPTSVAHLGSLPIDAVWIDGSVLDQPTTRGKETLFAAIAHAAAAAGVPVGIDSPSAVSSDRLLEFGITRGLARWDE